MPKALWSTESVRSRHGTVLALIGFERKVAPVDPDLSANKTTTTFRVGSEAKGDTMTDEKTIYCEGVILGEVEIEEIEEVVAPGFVLTGQ